MQFDILILACPWINFVGSLRTFGVQASKHLWQSLHPEILKSTKGTPCVSRTRIFSSQALTHIASHVRHSLNVAPSITYGGRTIYCASSLKREAIAPKKPRRASCSIFT